MMMSPSANSLYALTAFSEGDCLREYTSLQTNCLFVKVINTTCSSGLRCRVVMSSVVTWQRVTMCGSNRKSFTSNVNRLNASIPNPQTFKLTVSPPLTYSQKQPLYLFSFPQVQKGYCVSVLYAHKPRAIGC